MAQGFKSQAQRKQATEAVKLGKMTAKAFAAADQVTPEGIPQRTTWPKWPAAPKVKILRAQKVPRS